MEGEKEAQHDHTRREMVQILDALKENRDLLEAVIDNIPDVIVIQHPDHTVERLNRAGQELLGCSGQEAEGRACFSLLGRGQPCQGCVALEALKTGTLAARESYVPELGVYARFRATPVQDANGRLVRVVEHIQDVTEQKQVEASLRRERDYMYEIFDAMDQFVFVTSPQYRIEYMNRKAREAFGDMVGEVCMPRVGRKEPCPSCPIPPLVERGEPGPVNHYLEIWGRVMQGTGTRLTNLDGSISVLTVLEDITERRQAEEKIRYLSLHDPLTGLFNRAFVEQELGRLDKPHELPLSVLLADVNGLKLVNDAYGHNAGDSLLLQAANFLKTAVREQDIVARWGGDEFVVLLPRTSRNEAQGIYERISGQYKEWAAQGVPLSLSFGVATKNIPGEDLGEVLAQAEDSMYRQKLAEERSVRSTVLNALLRALGAKSCETEEHAQRMGDIARRIGRRLELPEQELNRLLLLVHLHDIGKITISEEILMKEGPLNQEEWAIMKTHPEVGFRIARSTEEFGQVAEEILAHHERWDGGGYPQGLRGEEIPFLSRIVAVADAFDAMTNSRPYRGACAHEAAVEEIAGCSGTQFDPRVVRAFLDLYLEGELE